MLVLAAIFIFAGLALITINARKLISDWPRLKPVHNVDAAWIKVYLGLTLIGIAWYLVGDPGRTWREQSTVIQMNPEGRPSAGSAGRPNP
jgi:hypothetical protein